MLFIVTLSILRAANFYSSPHLIAFSSCNPYPSEIPPPLFTKPWCVCSYSPTPLILFYFSAATLAVLCLQAGYGLLAPPPQPLIHISTLVNPFIQQSIHPSVHSEGSTQGLTADLISLFLSHVRHSFPSALIQPYICLTSLKERH